MLMNKRKTVMVGLMWHEIGGKGPCKRKKRKQNTRVVS